MADHDQRNPRPGSILFPWRKLKGLNPRSLIRSRINGQRDVGSSFAFAVSALKKRKGSTCPSCGAQKSVVLLEALPHESGDTTYVLGCNQCDYLENVEMKIAAVTKMIDNLRIGERRFLTAAACAAGFGFLYFFLTGYLFTLIGAMLIATMLLLNAMIFRYRVWQYVHKRLYEKKAPFADWLRHEFSA